MTSILLNWLNEEVHLSQYITSLDNVDDFKDGYLLGEILHKYNQQRDFKEFIHDCKPNSIVNNFCKLVEPLRSIGVHFDSAMAASVLNSNSPVIKRLLYDIKTSLDGIKRSNQVSELPPITSSSTGKFNLTRVVPLSKPKFEKSIDQSFENALRLIVENPKDAVMSKVTKRFDEKKTKFIATMTSREYDDTARIEEERHQYTDQLRSRKRHEKLFNDAWDHMNTEQWKVNQRVAHDRRERTIRFKTQQEDDHHNRRQQQRMNEEASTIQSIDLFEKKLASELFKDTTNDDELAAAVHHSYEHDGIGSASLSDTLSAGFIKAKNTLKDHHDHIAAERLVRDRHRGKFVAEQEAFFQRQIHHDGHHAVANMLLTSSMCEQNESEERDKVLIYQQIVQLNRQARDKATRALSSVIEKVDEEHKLEAIRREHDWLVSERLASQHDRVEMVKEAQAAAEHRQVEEYVGGLIDRLLDITSWVSSYKEFGLYGDMLPTRPTDHHLLLEEDEKGDDHPVPDMIWWDAMRLYESSIEIPSALPHPASINTATALPDKLSAKPLCIDQQVYVNKTFTTTDMMPSSSSGDKDEMTITRYLADLDMKSYLQDVRSFDITIADDIEVVALPAGRASIIKAPAIKKQTSNRSLVNTAEHEHRHILSAPSWLKSTALNHMVGEVLLSIDITADPIPAPPSPSVNLTYSTLPMRIALCGVSELARKKVSASLYHAYPGLKIINVEELVSHAIANKRDDGDDDDIGHRIESYLMLGKAIPDRIYVDLLVLDIRSIDVGIYPLGFIIMDYPATRTQALLLFEELSGINYASHRPQVSDRMNNFLSCDTRDEIVYDPVSCGLNAVLLFQNTSSTSSLSSSYADVDAAIEEKVVVRENLLDQSKCYLTYDMTMISPAMAAVMREEYDATRPVHLTGVNAMIAHDASIELQALLQEMKLMHMMPMHGYNSYDEVADAVKVMIASYLPDACISSSAIIDSQMRELQINDDHHTDDDVDGESQVLSIEQGSIISVDHDSSSTAEQPIASSSSDTSSSAIISKDEVKLPTKLAMIMHDIWKLTSQQCYETGVEFFQSMRDTRHMMSQRRRTVFDIMSRQLVCQDHRQSLYNAYRHHFNHDIEPDFRYDMDCKGELLLRAHELGDALHIMNDGRRSSSEEVLTTVASDGKLQLLLHRCQCEAAAFIQSELNRFFAQINILLDYMKAMISYDAHTCFANALEEVAGMPLASPISSPKSNAKRMSVAGVSKAAVKKKHDKEMHNERKLIAPIVLSDMVAAVAPKQAVVEVKSPKASKRPEKSIEVVEENKNPFEHAYNAAMNVMQDYMKGKFTVPHFANDDDDTITKQCQRAIWFEAEKFMFIYMKIKSMLDSYSQWMTSNEASMIDAMKISIHDRFVQESSVAERLIEMISDKIMNNEPIREIWYLASDALAVVDDRLVYADDPPAVTPAIQAIYPDRLNEEQMNIMTSWLKNASLGDLVLEQDLDHLLDRCSSTVGPNASIIQTTYIDLEHQVSHSFQHLTLPSSLRAIDGDGSGSTRIRSMLMKREACRPGTNEHSGVIRVGDILAKLQSMNAAAL